ncbi:MAG: nucleotidyl transferase AbiEii/AbiGii toxin family protein [Pseudomonadales bacterium]|nr:nucleotidyl transferase AbiEii/AbiGii toxin family protein [Pseudomonadales bacterium]
MPVLHHQNTLMLETVCQYLEPLLHRFVLVGGCATALLINDEAAPEVRPTLDVDLIVDVISWADYHSVESALQNIGFKQSQDEQGVICRWKIDSIIVDVMPTDEKILGFGNPWYKSAIEEPLSSKLSNGLVVKHVTAPYFIATKIEAFNGRGNGDFMVSHDLEDIVSVVDGRNNITFEIANCENKLKLFIVTEISQWLQSESFEDALPALLPPDNASQARLGRLNEKFRLIAEL